ncbi:MAG: hypothetical protein ACYTDV_19490, partial [Planctomycetota bacterium]
QDAYAELLDISPLPEALRQSLPDGGGAPNPVCRTDEHMIGSLDEKHKNRCELDVKNDKSKPLLVGHAHSELKLGRHSFE